MVISGPADPVVMDFLIPKILQTILESIWEHLGTHYFCLSEDQKTKLPKGKPPFFRWKFFFVYMF